MKIKGKKKELIVSISFLVFICAVFVSSFYFNQQDSGMQDVSGNAVANFDAFTNIFTLFGSLVGLVIVVVSVIMLANYLKRIRK